MDDKIECLFCGRMFDLLLSHLKFKHEMTPTEYKEFFGLDKTKGLTGKAYSKKTSDRVKELGIWAKNLESGVKTRFTKGDSTIGYFKRSRETQERLSKLNDIKYKKLRKFKKQI